MWLVAASLLVCVSLFSCPAFGQDSSHLGFDRNDYPGDSNLGSLRQTFSFSGYWLNNPPGAKTNTWASKRAKLEASGFGFLVLFNGRLYKELTHNPAALGQSDGRDAAASARREGFPSNTIIFLDIEEGGRMLPEQKAYIYAWVDAVTATGFRAGVYCSGIPAKEGKVSIVTADDIRQNAGGRQITFFVTNDVCPPSPGCAFPRQPPAPAESGINFADVWQFAQSPKRKGFAAKCPANYSADGNCYSPGLDGALKLHLDVETATSADPSQGR
jgi:Rv2525c-like, glycoside hydrolase-like domain